jgi:hypothetical protein
MKKEKEKEPVVAAGGQGDNHGELTEVQLIFCVQSHS